MIRCQELLDAVVEEVVQTRPMHVKPWNEVYEAKIMEDFRHSFISEYQVLPAYSVKGNFSEFI